MPPIKDITLVTQENFHVVIPNFLNEKKRLITSYEDMMEVIVQMVKEKHLFNMDRNLLCCMMEELTYMCCPGDEINKERVILQLIPSDEDDDEDDEDEEYDKNDIDRSAFSPEIKVNTLVTSDIED